MTDEITRPCTRCDRRDRSWTGWYAITLLGPDVLIVQALSCAPAATADQEVFCGRRCLLASFQALLDDMANFNHGSPVGGPLYRHS
jgi:hypothetical protein